MDFVSLVGLAAGFWHAGRRARSDVRRGRPVSASTTVAQEMSDPAWPATAAGRCVVAVLVWHRWVRTSATVTRWSARSRRKAGGSLGVRHCSAPHPARRCGVEPGRFSPPRTARLAGGPLVACPWRERRSGCAAPAWFRRSSVEDVVIVFGSPRAEQNRLAGRPRHPTHPVPSTGEHPHRPVRAHPRAPDRARPGLRVQRGRPRRPRVDHHVRPLTGCTRPDDRGGARGRPACRREPAGRGRSGVLEAQARRAFSQHCCTQPHWKPEHGRGPGMGREPGQAERDVLMLLRRSHYGVLPGRRPVHPPTTGPGRRSHSIMPASAGSPPRRQPLRQLLALASTSRGCWTTGDGLPARWRGQAAPLVCALTGHVAREARRLAADRPGDAWIRQCASPWTRRR
ncbi:hypothetical protein HBB16_13260 [Pseudonocardia sp. MCCB 268]|nr:hypothetical protein [Pseudonocardia cytotoxica]